MLQYPSILGVKKMPLGLSCYAFYKYDGSNIRFEWSPKKGWSKYGSRTQMIELNTPIYGEAIEIFHDTMAKSIIERLENQLGKNFKGLQRATAFAEFFGKNSFAGNHETTDTKELKLFDISLYKTGFISPNDFVSNFGDLDFSAKLVYKGNLNNDFIQKIRHNSLTNEPLNEGVICKGVSEKINRKTINSIWMTKIKTFDYINRLKDKYQDKWEAYSE